MSTTEMLTTCRLLCEKIDGAEAQLAEREKALAADYAKRLADSTADLRRNAVQSAAQLKDANAQVKGLQDSLLLEQNNVAGLNEKISRLEKSVVKSNDRIEGLEKALKQSMNAPSALVGA